MAIHTSCFTQQLDRKGKVTFLLNITQIVLEPVGYLIHQVLTMVKFMYPAIQSELMGLIMSIIN